MGGLFRVVRQEQRDRSGRDEVDRSLPPGDGTHLRDWSTEQVPPSSGVERRQERKFNEAHQ